METTFWYTTQKFLLILKKKLWIQIVHITMICNLAFKFWEINNRICYNYILLKSYFFKRLLLWLKIFSWNKVLIYYRIKTIYIFNGFKKISDNSFNLLFNLPNRSQITIQGSHEANKTWISCLLIFTSYI